MNIHVLTDSTADLGEFLIEKFNIEVIPLTVNLGDRSYLDGIEIQQDKLFELITEYGMLPTTAAPSVGEFKVFFKRGGESIYIGISSKLSATVPNARLTLDEFNLKNIRVIDSLNLSTGIGLLVLKAAELRDAGRTVTDIEGSILDSIPKVRTSFLIDTMDYLYKGGRCTALQAVAGSMLKIHPIIEVRSDGTLAAKEKVRGTRQKGLQALLDDFTCHLDIIDRQRIFITHTSCQVDAEYLKKEIVRLADPKEVHLTKTGSVIASHCGPGTIGILYLVK